LSSEGAAGTEPQATSGASSQSAEERADAEAARQELRLAVQTAKTYEKPPPQLEVEGEIVDFSGVDDPWMAYCGAYIKHHFGAEDSRALTPQQTRQLAQHLSEQDEIPF
jgi:hypothetical protein